MNIHNKFKFVWSQLNILLYKKHASMDLLYFLIECRYTNYGTFGTYAFQSKNIAVCKIHVDFQVFDDLEYNLKSEFIL